MHALWDHTTLQNAKEIPRKFNLQADKYAVTIALNVENMTHKVRLKCFNLETIEIKQELVIDQGVSLNYNGGYIMIL